jgi:hypothetical protein
MTVRNYGPVLTREQIIALATAGDENARFEATRWAYVHSGDAGQELHGLVHQRLAEAAERQKNG